VPDIERHLVLVHQRVRQDVADFLAIAARVRAAAPDIEVFVVENEALNTVTRRRAAAKPTLVFSPGPLGLFRPLRGTIRQGCQMTKLEEIEALSRGGAPVPAFAQLTEGFRPDPALFGEFVLIKPSFALSSYGQGIEVMRTRDVRYRPPQDYPANHPGREGPMIVQRLIDTGPARTFYRVLTLFGRVLIASRQDSTVVLPDISACAEPSHYAIKPDFNLGGRLSFTHEPEILAFASRHSAAMAEIPLQGMDIVRDAGSGDLYVLEINPGGNTWTFSRPQAAQARVHFGVDDLSLEFDSWRVAAEALIDRTRAEAT
jgi:hypothetical protein